MYNGNSFGLLSEEIGDADISRLVEKARVMEQEKKARILYDAIKKRKAQLGISFLEDHHQEDNHNVDEKEIKAISKIDHEPEVNKASKAKAKAKAKAKKSTKEKHHETNDDGSKIRKATNDDEYRKPIVENQKKKFIKSKTAKKIRKFVMFLIIVAILMAVLPDKNEIPQIVLD